MKNIIITKGTKDSIEIWMLGMFIIAVLLIAFIYGK